MVCGGRYVCGGLGWGNGCLGSCKDLAAARGADSVNMSRHGIEFEVVGVPDGDTRRAKGLVGHTPNRPHDESGPVPASSASSALRFTGKSEEQLSPVSVDGGIAAEPDLRVTEIIHLLGLDLGHRGTRHRYESQ